jgi:hypothetical protein
MPAWGDYRRPLMVLDCSRCLSDEVLNGIRTGMEFGTVSSANVGGDVFRRRTHREPSAFANASAAFYNLSVLAQMKRSGHRSGRSYGRGNWSSLLTKFGRETAAAAPHLALFAIHLRGMPTIFSARRRPRVLRWKRAGGLTCFRPFAFEVPSVNHSTSFLQGRREHGCSPNSTFIVGRCFLASPNSPSVAPPDRD